MDESLLETFKKTFHSRWGKGVASETTINKKLADPSAVAIAKRVKSGSTALVLHITGNEVVIANAGDCRAGERRR